MKGAADQQYGCVALFIPDMDTLCTSAGTGIVPAAKGSPDDVKVSSG